MKMIRLNNLQRIRKECGFTRAELERSSGVCSSTIQKLENGSYDVNMVKLGTLIALAQALHCKVVDLLDKDLQKVIG